MSSVEPTHIGVCFWLSSLVTLLQNIIGKLYTSVFGGLAWEGPLVNILDFYILK